MLGGYLGAQVQEVVKHHGLLEHVAFMMCPFEIGWITATTTRHRNNMIPRGPAIIQTVSTEVAVIRVLRIAVHMPCTPSAFPDILLRYPRASETSPAFDAKSGPAVSGVLPKLSPALQTGFLGIWNRALFTNVAHARMIVSRVWHAKTLH